MKRIFQTLPMLVAVFSNNVSCGSANMPDIPLLLHANIGGIGIQLMDADGKCTAISSVGDASANRHVLDIPGPCHFHADQKGGLRTYDDAGYVYILIESSRPMPQQPRDCETQLQSLRVKDNLVEVSRHKDRVASCPPFQWDAFIFKALFD